MQAGVMSNGGETGARAGIAGRAALAASTFGRLPPTVLLLLAIVSVQLGAALASALFDSLGPAGTAFATSLISAAVLSLERSPRTPGDTRLSRLKRHWHLILLFGVVDSAMVLPFFLAMERIPLGLVATITFLGPLGLAVATSRRLVHFLWIAVAGIGVALLTPEFSTGLDPVGLLYAAIGAVAWAGFVLLSKRAGAAFPGHEALAWGLWASAAILLPMVGLEHSLFAADPGDLLAALPVAFGVSVLGTVLPLALEFRALQRMSARTYGILVTLEPAVGALVGVVCLGQPASPRMVIAVVCVMLAALGVTLSDRRE